MMRLKDEVAIVTGGSMGLGRAIAELFAEEGATVVSGDIRQPEQETDGIESEHLDVSKYSDWEALVERVLQRHGKIDILVNNAGVIGSYENIDVVDLKYWDSTIAVNLTGVFYGMRAVIPAMRQAGGGAIVNVSSIWGITAAAGNPAYHASKGAVRILSKNAAMTYATQNIRINSLHPGQMDTPLVRGQAKEVTQSVLDATPMGRISNPREVAYGALFLASKEASFVTGAELVVDGGYTAQ